MEALAAQQKKTGDEIDRILTNIKKDSRSRKTKEYVQKRLGEIQSLWSQFVLTNEKIVDYQNTHTDHAYFATNYFGQVEGVYKKAKELLENITTDTSTEDSQASQKSNITKLLRNQRSKIQTLQILIESIQKELTKGDSKSKTYFDQNIEMLQEYFETIRKNHEMIIENATEEDEESDYIKELKYNKMEGMYRIAVIDLHERRAKLATSLKASDELRTMPSPVQKLKLPPVSIPVFNGNYYQWKSFHDLYTQLIHNNANLGKAQKMHYLKSNITGDASKLLQHLQITDANYETAWELLNNRYNNTRLLVTTQLHTLLNQNSLNIESANGIKKLHDTTQECLLAIKNLGVETSGWGPIIAYIIIQKLDRESQKLYEQSLESPREIQTLKSVLKFLECRFQSLEVITNRYKGEMASSTGTKTLKSYVTFKNIKRVPKEPQLKNNSPPGKLGCSLCRGEHPLFSCMKFLNMGAKQRMELVKQKSLCTNCLRSGHTLQHCKSWKSCRVCHQKHNTLLHIEQQSAPKPVASSYPANPPTTSNQQIIKKPDNTTVQTFNTETTGNPENCTVLLATALVNVICSNGTVEQLRALIDQGSQASLITEEATQRLRLQKNRCFARVSGVGSSKSEECRSSVNLTLMPRFPSSFQLQVTAIVLKNLTKSLPNEELNNCGLNHINNLVLADPSYHKPGRIDLILGADVYGDIILNGLIKGPSSAPLAQRSEFGWLLSGYNKTAYPNKQRLLCLVTSAEIDRSLKRFWETEEVSIIHKLSPEEIECEHHYKANHFRTPDGRYTVAIPFNTRKETLLGQSRGKALVRLLHMERKFLTNQSFGEEYKKFMKEYIALGHMKLLNKKDSKIDQQGIYYLPHHAVLKEESLTTKLRVVFDASAKTSTGVSLNDKMLNGPVLQQELVTILMRWRKHKIVLSADIEKMYRQINMSEEHQNYQRILWRNSPKDPIEEYKLTTVTYGTRSAPYLAIKTLHQLAQDEEENYSEASTTLINDFYVDDLLTGCDSIQMALKKQVELSSILEKGGFKLRKWNSNSVEVLRHIPMDIQSNSSVHFDDTESIKTLGILWQPHSDTFTFKANLTINNHPVTKRRFLSEASRLFDPLGLITPITVQVKLLFQELCQAGISWDEELPKNVANQWIKIRNELPQVEKINIPRWIGASPNNQICELHGFSDASERAYAAAIYVRNVTVKGDIKVALLTSKTKVAPISKKPTLARLELCGAVLLAKLFKQVREAMQFQHIKIYAYTDSTIVLAWIRGHPSKWKPFVGHRVAQIQEELTSNQWYHVKTNDNPADYGSRGMSPSRLSKELLWWYGPVWLSQGNIPLNKMSNLNTDEERRINSNTTLVESNEFIINILSRFSKLSTLIRVLAFCKRFINNIRTTTEQRKICELSVAEVDQARFTIIKWCQELEFSSEVRTLQAKQQIHTKSKLANLNPFLDENGILRVGGRLANAPWANKEKHPIILPYKSYLTSLIIDMAHKRTLHGGNKLTLQYIRQEYWILKGYSAVKQHIHRCVVCHRFKAKAREQLMGNLPRARITASRPFTNCGVDYAGPIDLRISKGRGTKTYKGYVAIFICLATKAIHLEVVSDMTAQAFIAAFKRFTGRRGNVKNMYSDNGSNFVHANKILSIEAINFKEIYKSQLQHMLTETSTEWHFIPPYSPHFGGLWEAGVKSMKQHLRKIVGDKKLTYEELQTVLVQIEACLNSRPLCAITEDPESLDTLTPGHFLIGSALLAPPSRNMLEENIHSLTRWQFLDRLNQEFWKRWSTEYLNQLQQRPKWTKLRENIKIGELVLIREENIPPTRWALGRVIQTHEGKDGVARVVSLKTANNIVKRPLSKISPLPIEDNDRKQTKERTVKANTKIMQTFHISAKMGNIPQQQEFASVKVKGGILNKSTTKLCSTSITGSKSNEAERKTSRALSASLISFPRSQDTKLTLTTTSGNANPHVQRSAKFDLGHQPIDYGTLTRKATQEAMKSRQQSNPRNVKIRPVTGYSNLVSLEAQRQATLAYRKRYNNKKRSCIEENEHDKFSMQPQAGNPSFETQRSVPRKKTCTLGAIMSLLLVTLFILPGIAKPINQPVEITTFKFHPGLYFEELGQVKIVNSEWNIIGYYDLQGYWQELAGIRNCMEQLDQLCNLTKVRKHYCTEILTQFQHQLLHIEEINDLLYKRGGNNQHITRQKRAPLNIIGNIANKLFGVLDSDYANYIEEEVNKARINENHLLNLIKNQTSIVESTINIFKKEDEQIRAQFKIIKDHLTTLSLHVTEGETRQLFNSLSIHTTLIFYNFERIQNAIVNVLIDLQHGKINPLLLTVPQLRAQVSLIRNNLPTTLTIPGSKENEELSLYNLMTARARVTQSHILFNIKIPLVHITKYQLFKLVPVPTLHNESFVFIKPSTEYLIVSFHRDKYYPLNHWELDRCNNYEFNEYLCKQSHPIYNLNSNISRCEMMLLNHEKPLSSDCQIHVIKPSKLWIQLHSPNSWLYVLDQEYTFNIVCEDSVLSKTLQGDGILKLRGDCALKEDSMTISGHSLYESSLNSSFIPTTNLSAQLPRELWKNIGTTKDQLLNTKEIELISRQLQDLKEKQELPSEFSTHDVHHYTFIYLMLMAGAATVAYLGFNHYKQQCRKKPIPAPRTMGSQQGSTHLTADDFVLQSNTEGEHVQEAQQNFNHQKF